MFKKIRMNYDYTRKNLFQKNGASKLFIDKIKSIVGYRNRVLVIALKDDLPNSKVWFKTGLVWFHKLLSISPILLSKKDQ